MSYRLHWDGATWVWNQTCESPAEVNINGIGSGTTLAPIYANYGDFRQSYDFLDYATNEQLELFAVRIDEIMKSRSEKNGNT